MEFEIKTFVRGLDIMLVLQLSAKYPEPKMKISNLLDTVPATCDHDPPTSKLPTHDLATQKILREISPNIAGQIQPVSSTVCYYLDGRTKFPSLPCGQVPVLSTPSSFPKRTSLEDLLPSTLMHTSLMPPPSTPNSGPFHPTPPSSFDHLDPSPQPNPNDTVTLPNLNAGIPDSTAETAELLSSTVGTGQQRNNEIEEELKDEGGELATTTMSATECFRECKMLCSLVIEVRPWLAKRGQLGKLWGEAFDKMKSKGFWGTRKVAYPFTKEFVEDLIAYKQSFGDPVDSENKNTGKSKACKWKFFFSGEEVRLCACSRLV